MGDGAEVMHDTQNRRSTIEHTGLRIVRGVSEEQREDLLHCWCELWVGTTHSQQSFKNIQFAIDERSISWRLEDANA